MVYLISFQILSLHFQLKNHETFSEIQTIATQCYWGVGLFVCFVYFFGGNVGRKASLTGSITNQLCQR